MLPGIFPLCTAALAMVLTSCRHGDPTAAPPKPAAAPALYEWNGANLAGPVSVRIDLSEQKARFTRGGQPAGWTYVAAGTNSHPTPTGSFRITEKVADKSSTSWGVIVDAAGDTVNSNAKNGRAYVPSGGRFVGAPMPFWMRINGPIGMHAGHIPSPGSPASHGCIRLPRDMAEILFGVTTIGTPVQVIP